MIIFITKQKRILDTHEKRIFNVSITYIYKAFHRFGQAKILDDGLVLVSSQFSILPRLPPKTAQFKTVQN